MRHLCVAVVLCCLVCGCAGTTYYSTTAQIVHTEKPGEYVLQAQITENYSSWWRKGGSTHTAPRVTFLAGQPAMCTISTQTPAGDLDGYFLEVYVPKEGEQKNTSCKITVKEKGKVVSSTEFTLPPFAKP